MRLIAENNLSAENHYFQATNTTNEVLKFKTLFPVLQNFYELLALGWGLFGLLFSFITLGFFYRIVAEEKSSHLHFSSLKKTEVSNQYIFQFNLGSTDWSCSSKLNKVQQNFKTSHSTTKFKTIFNSLGRKKPQTKWVLENVLDGIPSRQKYKGRKTALINWVKCTFP